MLPTASAGLFVPRKFPCLISRGLVQRSVFFDLGETLVIPRLSDNGSLLELKVLPFVPDVLDKLRGTEVNNMKLRLGVISNTGEETLARMRSVMAEARLLDFFDPALLMTSVNCTTHVRRFLGYSCYRRSNSY